MTGKPKGSARDRIRAFLRKNVGKVVTTQQLRRVAGISEYARRIRELRDDEGMAIQSHHDAPDLKPNEYRLACLEPSHIRVSHKVDRAQRMRILERNGFMCTLCGLAAGDPDPDDPSRKVRLHIDHEDPDGPATDENLRVTCNVCNEGRSNLGSLPAPSLLRVMREARRLPKDQQLDLLRDLQKRLGVG